MYRFILGYGIDPPVPPLPTANTRLRFCMWDQLRKGIKNKDLVVKQLLRLCKLNTFDLNLVLFCDQSLFMIWAIFTKSHNFAFLHSHPARDEYLSYTHTLFKFKTDHIIKTFFWENSLINNY